mgnify:CR=1 FL=1
MRKFMKVVVSTVFLSTSMLFVFTNNVYAATKQSNREQPVKTVEISAKAEEVGKGKSVESNTSKTTYTKREEKYFSVQEVQEQMDYAMDLSEPCGLSKESFVKLMEELPYDYTGFYERNAEFIWEMEQEYNVNAIFVCGIIAQESGWARYDACKNNYSGTMGSKGYASFESEEEGIEYTFNNLQNGYISNGLTTVSTIAPTYVGYSGSGWDSNVFSAMKMIIKSGC